LLPHKKIGVFFKKLISILLENFPAATLSSCKLLEFAQAVIYTLYSFTTSSFNNLFFQLK